jgi:DeoR/GlpR family transcriptional regulator of sugar metabolism
MLPAERHVRIVSILEDKGVINIEALSDTFGVSRNTVRRDLRRLEEQGLLRLTHGGAVATNQVPMGRPVQERADLYVDQRQRIGATAAKLVREGDSVLLDAGTTTEQIALHLKPKSSITVITNALNVAAALAPARGITTVVIGGILNNVTGCTAGFHAEQFLYRFHVNKAFISAGGVTEETAYNTNAFEVQMKQEMMDAADEAVLVVSSNKIGATSLAAVCPVSEFSALVTDDQADERILSKIRALGVEVILC